MNPSLVVQGAFPGAIGLITMQAMFADERSETAMNFHLLTLEQLNHDYQGGVVDGLD